MTITKLKAKNQVTIPIQIVERLRLKPNELFAVEVEGNFIKLTPVEIAPRYSPEELSVIDRIVEKEKDKGKSFKAGKGFQRYIKKIAK